MDTILVPIDGSAFADSAARVAAAIASRTGASVHLLSVASADDQPELRDHLDGLAAQLPAPTVATVSGGDPATVILELADRSPTTIICLADRGRSALGDLLAGSVSEQVLARSQRPVLVVGPNCRHEVFTAEPSGPIVLCIDDRPDCEAILEPAARLATAAGLDVVLVEVVPPEERVEIDDVPHVDAPTAQGQRRLREVAASLAAHGIERPGTKVLYGADIAEAVAHHATEHAASLIAVATHGRAGVHRLLHGSTTHHLIPRAPCPILAVRCWPPDATPTGR